MIEVVRNGLHALSVSVIASSIFAPIMIALLYKLNQVSGLKKTKIGGGEGDNTLFMKIMNVGRTNGTPNMGGVLIWILVPAICLLLIPLTPIIKVFLLGFFLYGLWGFIDVVVFTNGFKNNEKMKAMQETFEWRLGKLLFSTLMNIGIMFLLYRTGMFGVISVFSLLIISVTPVILVLLGLVGQLAIYAAELTDGLDGLMIGIFMTINIAMIVLLVLQGKAEFIPILAIILGVQIIDLYFNIPPARFWNGGPGAMPLGFAMFFIAIVTDNLIPYFAMSFITWGIMASSAIQMISMKFFKKRVFRIAPIHHHFQAKGWPQTKVVMRFWLFTLITCILGIYLGLI
jgi:phospho-N-acetylmuramoyl-pentapeptide-transferase